MSTTRPDSWMPWYIADYMADTLHLTTEEHGAYLLLIAAYWRAGCALPNDDARLCSITKMKPARWKRCRTTIERFFEVSPSGWFQKRIEIELKTAHEKSERAKLAAEAKWRKANETPNAPASFKHMPNACPTDAPQQSPLSETNVSARQNGAHQTDPKKILFDFGLSILTSAGTPDDKARAMIGKWRKELHDDPELMKIFASAQRAGPIGPVSYLMQAVANACAKKKYGGGYVPPGVGG